MSELQNKTHDYEYYKEKLLEKYLSSNVEYEKINKRYIHSIGVSNMSVKLIDIFNLNIDKEKAKIASILHDYAKFTPFEDYLDIIKELNLDPVQAKDEFKVLHATLGRYIVQRELGIDDKEILDAIETHTTGCKNMTELQEIIYLSDCIEENRKEEYFITLRKLAMKNYKKAIAHFLKDTIDRITRENKSLNKYTLAAYNDYKKYLEKEESYKEVLDCLDHNLIKDVVVYDSRQKSPFYDYIIVCSTTSNRQMEACVNYLRDDFDIRGKEIGETWTLIDLNDVIIHIFKDEEREKFGIDRIYANLPILK